MNRRGFALLTVLWAVALASAVVGATIAAARLQVLASENRVTLTRAAWARDACREILLARIDPDSAMRPMAGAAGPVRDTIHLGRGTWCRAAVEDPGAKLNLNTADAEALRLLLGSDSLVDALLDWRDADDVPRPLGAERTWYVAQGRPAPRNGELADLGELMLVRGFDSASVARLAPLVTTRGDGRVNLAAAPPEVLATLPGMTESLARLLLAARADGRLTSRPAEFVDALPSDARRALLARYQDFAMRTSATPGQLVARIEGGVRGRAPVARETLALVPVPGRLAVLRREFD
ncbi:MAG TPA: hypothetical protein VFS33_04215 [Gemmatimonadales bacterium]|nr:hypothetical protein [Gemmatimonadales bacterium]